MRLVPNWRAVLRYGWSVRFIAAAALLSGVEAAWPFFIGTLPWPPGLVALATCLITTGALVARFVAQKNVSGEHDE